MKKRSHYVWISLIGINALVWFMFSAAPPADADLIRNSTPPANPAAQRGEMVRELKAIKRLLQEQNQILRSGMDNVFDTDP